MIDVNEVRRLADAGNSDQQIADIMGYTKEWVRCIRWRYGILPGGTCGRRPRTYHMYDDTGKEVFCGTAKQCADFAGCKPGAIYSAESGIKGNSKRIPYKVSVDL